MCVCFFFPFILDVRIVGCTCRVTQEEGNTGCLIHLPSAGPALTFPVKVRPFLSLVDRGVEFCVLTILSFSTCWAFLFIYFIFIFVRKNPSYRDSNSRPNVSEVLGLPTELPGRPALSSVCVCLCFLPIHSGHEVRCVREPRIFVETSK